MWLWYSKTETFIEFFVIIDFRGNYIETSTENTHNSKRWLKWDILLKSLCWEISSSIWKALRIVEDQIQYLYEISGSIYIYI